MCSGLLQLAPGSCGLSHFVNLLSFTQQLFSSQLKMNHVIQQPSEAAIAKYNEKKIKNNIIGP